MKAQLAAAALVLGLGLSSGAVAQMAPASNETPMTSQASMAAPMTAEDKAAADKAIAEKAAAEKAAKKAAAKKARAERAARMASQPQGMQPSMPSM